MEWLTDPINRDSRLTVDMGWMKLRMYFLFLGVT